MALTQAQKNLLDEKIKEIVTPNITFSYKNIIYRLSDFPTHLSSTSVASSIRRVYPDYVCVKEFKTNYILKKFEYALPIYTTDYLIKKEKNLLYLYSSRENLFSPICYDFITKKFITEINDDNCKNYDLLRVKSLKNILAYEWVFNYLANFETIYSIIKHHKIVEMPKDFACFVNSLDHEPNTKEILEYIQVLKYGRFLYNLQNSCDIEDIDFIVENNLEKIIRKILVVSAKNGNVSSIYSYISTICDYLRMTKKFEILDTNRDFKYNAHLTEKLMAQEEKFYLEKNLQKLNFINGVTLEDRYIIVVPQTTEEKADEGKQQNNCVGYYYDRTIVSGENLIYFIRKTDEPTKSYVTCRYEIKAGRTVEYRTKNNNSVTKEIVDLIKGIDVVINEKLSK